MCEQIDAYDLPLLDSSPDAVNKRDDAASSQQSGPKARQTLPYVESFWWDWGRVVGGRGVFLRARQDLGATSGRPCPD